MTKRVVRRNRKGFTLLEVLMVLVILGVIAVLVLTQIGGAVDKGKVDAAHIALKTIGSKLELFKAHCGRYPTSDEGLGSLLEKPSDEDIAAKWGGPYVDKDQLKDPWEREFIYAAPGQVNERGFDLSSAGPDRVEGNDDDIANWTKS